MLRSKIVFLDGWGFGREEKVLYITIIRCKHLNAMDVSTGARQVSSRYDKESLFLRHLLWLK